MLKRRITDFTLTAGEFADMPCSIPFSMYSVLIALGKITNPYKDGDFSPKSSAVSDTAIIRSKINISAEELSQRRVYLKIWGVHAECEFYFNGKSYGVITSPNRIYTFDVTDMAKVGDNDLCLNVTGVIPNRYVLDADGNRDTSLATAPYLADLGIFGGCELIPAAGALINDVRVTEQHEANKVTIMVDMDVVGTDDGVRAIATLRSPTGAIYYTGISMGHGIIVVKDPELWWPNGLGPADLYTLTVTLYSGGEAIDSYTRKIGLRSISVGKDENGVPAIVVNGVKIFSRGATYVRENAILPYVKAENTERILRAAKEANMNTVRVVSEGIAPSDEFYDICDRYGLIVWQDVPVPYILPPIQGAFAAGITAALRDTIARVAAHPSVALLYLSVMESDGGDSPASPESLFEFSEIASRILRPVLERYAVSCVYVADPFVLFSYDERQINRDECYGAVATLPTAPDIRTVASFAQPDDRNLLSLACESHSPIPNTARDILLTVANSVRLPSGMAELTYASGVAAGNVLSRRVRDLRAAENRSMSAVLRQLNDPAPMISPSMIDFYGREKAVLKFASKFYAPVVTSVSVSDFSVTARVINERRRAFGGRLMLALYTKGGECIYETEREISVLQTSVSSPVFEDLSSYVSGMSDSVYLLYRLTDQNGIVDSGTEIFMPAKHFAFDPPAVEAEINGMLKSFTVKLTSPSYQKNVHLAFDGMDARFDTDYVDHLGWEPLQLSFETADVTTPSTLMKKLRIFTVGGIGKQS